MPLRLGTLARWLIRWASAHGARILCLPETDATIKGTYFPPSAAVRALARSRHWKTTR